MPLQLVPPGEPTPAEQVRLRVKKAPKPAALLQCNRCGGRELIETRSGVLLKNGKASGGTKQLICSLCLSKGERVVVA